MVSIDLKFNSGWKLPPITFDVSKMIISRLMFKIIGVSLALFCEQVVQSRKSFKKGLSTLQKLSILYLIKCQDNS